MSADTPAAWLIRNARDHGGAPALLLNDETLDWRTLARRVASVARNMEPGRAAAVRTERAVHMVTALYAAPLAGCALLPLDPARSSQALIEATGAVSFDGPWEGEADLPATLGLVASDVHLIVATSGSGGAPKGVMLTGASLASAAAASRERLGLDARDCWLCCLPLFHVGGLSIPLRCAEAGATVRLHDGFDAERVWADLGSGEVTHVSLVPAMLARLLDVADGSPPPTLRRVLVGGASLSEELAVRARDAGWPLSPTWGMSETASQAATLPAMPGDWHPGLVGRPLDGLDVRTRDDGRLCLRGPMVMAGYANPALVPGDGLEEGGWLVTGDAGEIDDQGRVVVTGRADAILVSGGETIHPAEVEGLLAACPGISSAGVTARPDPVWGDVLVAVVTGEASEEAVLAWCRDHIPGARRPREVRVVDHLPLTALGKPDRPALREMVRN